MEEEEYEIPLRDQRMFGSGLKRKRIQFVPSASTNLPGSPITPSTTVADRYRELVLKGKRNNPPLGPSDGGQEGNTVNDNAVGHTSTRCEICNRPINNIDPTASHESSIVHQFCLKHSHPPSSIDRRRKGLAVLKSQGWDPDERKGLGVEGGGILHPVKAIDNPDRAGLGSHKSRTVQQKPKPVKLDAGRVRLMEKEGKKKAERLREAFYRSEDVLKYLGE